MTQAIQIEVDVPDELATLTLPTGVQARLQALLDRQDAGVALTPAEREEAEGLVDLTELLSILRMRAERAAA